MKKILAFSIAFVAAIVSSNAQITCTNASHSTLTNYTNGAPNDSLFFICAGQTATLLATPPSGTPGWDFVWQQFNVAGNSWNALNTANGVPSSELSLLQPGGYRVIITDGTSEVVGTYIVWVCRINVNPSVNVNAIPAGCGSVQLSGQINGGTITPYYNPPSLISDPNNALIVGGGTSITVCFTGIHTWISDLGFYLVGPASCGSPTIMLSPNPGSNGQGMICNSSDNFTNLCFSNQSTNIFNPCSPGTYSGTYGGYGVGAGTMINWSTLSGCDASQAGWSVQVYDCVGGDVGSLTGASISFNGTSVGGSPITYSYNTPSGFSSPIADNSCNPVSASIFTVPSAPAQVINFLTTYQWTANPPFTIPNSTNSLNINLNPGPTVDTQFTLSLAGNHPGAICGGTSSDTELFDYIEPGVAVIDPVATTYCTADAAFNLSANIAGGAWSGNGITNATNGTFNPAQAGVGNHTITYTPTGSCVTPASVTLEVVSSANVQIQSVNALCSNASSLTLQSNTGGGTWSGTGITDATNGVFDPTVAGSGTHTITYSVDGACPGSGTTSIEVVSFVTPSILGPSMVCINDPSSALTSDTPGGTWSGTGITDATNGIFNPGVVGIGSTTLSYALNDNACSAVATITIEVTGESMVIVTPVNPLCITSSNITLSASQSGGVWNGTGITNQSAGVFSPAIAGPGNHNIHYQIPGACPANGYTTIVVVEEIQPIITAPSSICENAASVLLTATPAGGTWTGTAVNTAGLFNPTTAGNGNATVTYSIGGTCPASTNAIITVNPIPSVVAGNNVSICAGGSTILNASGAQSYTWSPSAGLSASTIASPTASPGSTTTYTVTGTSNGCSSTDQITVTVNSNPTVVVNGPFAICPGDTVLLNAVGLSNYSWTPSNTLSASNIANPFASPNSSTVYTVTGADINGCSGQASINVDVFYVEFIFTPEEGLAPLSPVFTNLSDDAPEYFWDFGNGDVETTTDPDDETTTTYENEGLFTITLSATNGNTTCSVDHTVFVFVDAEIFIIPDIVTPDGSGKNDRFRILNQGMRTMSVQIFDRWGRKVGTLETPNGTWDPRDYSDGTYYYTLKAEGMDGTKFENAGYFNVTRKL